MSKELTSADLQTEVSQGSVVEILINGQVISYSLDQEETLDQVLSQLTQWAQSQGTTIADVYVNEQKIQQRWPRTPLTEVAMVELRLFDDEDGMMSRLSKAERSCRRLLARIEGGVEDGSLSEGLGITEDVGALIPSFPWQTFEHVFTRWQQAGEAGPLRKELVFLLEQLQHYILLLNDEQAYRNMLCRQLRLISKDLANLEPNFRQKGMVVLVEAVHRLLGWLSDFERFALRNREGAEQYQGLHPILAKVEQAMKENNWPLVSDLLACQLREQLAPLFQCLTAREHAHTRGGDEHADLA